MFKVLRKIVQYPRVTLSYPKKPMDSRLFIGKPEIHGDKCTHCGACISRCPSGAIVESPETHQPCIHLDACIFCALCEEICPAGAIQMTTQFELADKKKEDLRADSAVERKESQAGNQAPQSAEQASDESSDEESYEELGRRVELEIKKRFGRSLQIREVDAGSCNACDNEINTTNNPFNDIERFGIHFVASPRHADMLLVTGTGTRNMELALGKTYEATPNPKLVVAVGACACSGGIFQDSYATKNGIDTIVPVDAYIPGCPPRPQAILYGILKAIDRI